MAINWTLRPCGISLCSKNLLYGFQQIHKIISRDTVIILLDLSFKAQISFTISAISLSSSVPPITMATYLWKGFTSSSLDSSSSLGIIGDQLAFVELVVALLPELLLQISKSSFYDIQVPLQLFRSSPVSCGTASSLSSVIGA